MANFLFSKDIKVADLISDNPNILLILPRVGIQLGFGECTVDEICKKNHISTDFFLLLCNVYSFDHYAPTEKQLQSMDMSLLEKYLKSSHEYYLQNRIPHIGNHLKEIIKISNPRIGVILEEFFAQYTEDVEKHFKYEETIVFPHLKSLMSGVKDNKYSIDRFAESHTNIEDKLNDLTNILLKYLPEVIPSKLIEIVFDTVQLVNDLHKHSFIEEKILAPYVSMLERKIE